MIARGTLLLPLLSPALLAQAVVSPDYCAPYEGVTDYATPFDGANRLLQVHQDLTAPFLVRAIGLRRDGVRGVESNAVPRQLTAELRMGTAATTLSSTFASNYAGASTVVFPRATLAAPPWVRPGPDMPAAFDFLIPLAVPYVHAGTGALAWEIDISANSAAGLAYPADGIARALGQPGNYVRIGVGCDTAGGRHYEHRSAFSTFSAGPASFSRAQWTVDNGPMNAASALLIGVLDPALPVPGLCGDGRLHVGPMVALGFTTDANGAWTSPSMQVGYYTAPEGTRLLSQAATPDATQPALPIAVSDGIASTMPFEPGGHSGPPVPIARVLGSGGATTGTVFAASGLVTQFR